MATHRSITSSAPRTSTRERRLLLGAVVCSSRFGWGEPGDLPLHVAVQASCALPPAFPPRWLPVARHRFEHGSEESAGTERMALVDAGVYDNQADQWFLGVRGRRRRFQTGSFASFRARTSMEDSPDAEHVIVVNASGGLACGRLGTLIRHGQAREGPVSATRQQALAIRTGGARSRARASIGAWEAPIPR
jgi:hypothetical protein